MLSEIIKKRIKTHSQRESPRECCGFIILNHDNQLDSIEVKNCHENPYKYVSVNPRDYLNVEQLGEIKAFYHSHVIRESFSEVDKKNSIFNEMPYILYCIESDSFDVFFENSIKSKYCNIDFEWGKNDCFNLIINYYWNEFRIKIENHLPNRTESWWKNAGDLVAKYKEFYGFYEVIEPENHDLIVFETNRNQFHFGIYLEGEILHHPRAKKSLIESYNDKMQLKTKYILRNRNIKLK